MNEWIELNNVNIQILSFLKYCMYYKSKRGGEDHDSIQSDTKPDPGYHMGKWQKHNKTSQTRAKRSAFSQQVNTRQQNMTNTNINNKNDPQKKLQSSALEWSVNFFSGLLKPV